MERRKKSKHYGGGWEYYCNDCGHAHHILSELGKRHIVYANSDTKKKAFKDYGIYVGMEK